MNQSDLRTDVAVGADPLDPTTCYRSVQDPRAGATVVFAGVARDHSPGKDGVTHLEYEAYAGQVEPKIGEIVVEARRRWDVLHVTVRHRTGVVEVGEASVLVAVSSAHRAEAFAAARFLIDELKERAPIWKKEHWAGGAEWVEGA